MTDKFNEHSEASEDSLSFKDQILRDLQEATRLRSLREEEHNKSATMPETPLSTSAESATTRSDSVSNKVSNQDFSSHSVSHSAFAKSMTSETARDSQQDSLSLFSDSQAESLVSDAHSNLASIPKEPIEEEKKVNIPQETETSKRRFKRPVWETSLNEASEEEYIPADVAKELIEAKSNEAIYTDPKELEAKLTSERQKEAFLQEHHATSDQASQEKVQSELVADGNEDDESISLEPSGKPKKKKGKKVKKKKSSPKDGKQADIVDEEPISRSNYAITSAEGTKYTSLDDLSGKTTEVLPGSNYAQLLENWNHANADKTPITINYASSSTGLSTRIQHIQEGKIDFILYDAISSEYIVKDQGYKPAVNKIKDDIGMKTDGLEYLLFSNDKQGKELKTFVNKRIKELKKDGTLAKLSKEYFGGDYVSDLK